MLTSHTEQKSKGGGRLQDGELKQIYLSAAYEKDCFMPESIQGLPLPLEAIEHSIAPNIQSDCTWVLGPLQITLSSCLCKSLGGRKPQNPRFHGV